MLEEFVNACNDFGIIRNHLLRGVDEKKLTLEKAQKLITLRENIREYSSFYDQFSEEFVIINDFVANNSPSEIPGISEISVQKDFNPEKKEELAEVFIVKTKPQNDLPINGFTSDNLLEKSQQIFNAPINNYIPHDNDLDLYFNSKGVVGDEEVRKILVYGLLANANLGIESLSGAGKSNLVNAVKNLFPSETYLSLQQASPASFFNDQHINDFNYFIISELQKVKDPKIIEMMKTLAENEDYTYIRTNKNNSGVDKITITPKSMLYSLAITNNYFKQKDEELNRRFIILSTDVSKKLNEKVLENYSLRQFSQGEDKEKIELVLQEHIKNILELKSQQKFNFINPFSGYLATQLPEEIKGNLRVRSFMKHYDALVYGHCLFHHQERLFSENDLFSSLSDNLVINELYGNFFHDNIIGLSVIDSLLLETLEIGQEYELNKPFYTLFEEKGCYLKNSVIENSINYLCELRFLENNHGVIKKLKNNPKMGQINLEEALNYADQLMQEKRPDLHGYWLESCKNELP